MLKLAMTKDALSFVQELQAKQFKQVMNKILDLIQNPNAADSEKLKGYEYLRVDCGEFRIVFKCDKDILSIVLVAKRNDDEVYKKLSRK